MFVGKNFLPADDQSQFNVLVRTPEGTSLAATTNMAERIAREVRELPGVLPHADDGRRRRRSRRERGLHLREADRTDQRKESQQQMMMRAREDAEELSARNSSPAWNWCSAIGGNRATPKCSTLIAGPDLDKLSRIFATSSATRSRRSPTWWTPIRRFAPASRKCASKSTAQRAADLGVRVSRHRRRSEHAGRGPGGLHLQCRRRPVRCPRARRRASIAPASTA